MTYREWMIKLVTGTGGLVEDERFVTKPGCLIVAETAIDPAANALLDAMGISPGADYARLGELTSRLSYLSFKEAADSATNYLDRVANKMQHMSIFNGTNVTFLIAGISVETSLELIAHHEARVGRLTTSNTAAMDDPLFRLQGSPMAQRRQRGEIMRLMDRVPIAGEEREFMNMNRPGSKCTAITFTMSLKDFHSFFIGRMPEKGNETEVREVAALMCTQLHERFPIAIREVAAYLSMGNGAKYALT